MKILTIKLPQGKLKHIVFFLIFSLAAFSLFGQDTLSNGKAFNFPFQKYGISIGNSHEFSGIRFNFRDKDVKRINGLNVTLWIKINENLEADFNGINLGMIPAGKKMNGLKIGLLGCGTSGDQNGISFGGLVVGCGGNINGLSISGIYTSNDGRKSELSGVAISGLLIASGHGINGIGIGGLSIISDHHINGMVLAGANIAATDYLNGLTATIGYLDAGIVRGVSVAGYSKTEATYGLSIALFNKTNHLHGLQLGLLNYAGNNPKGLKYLPLMNLNFGKVKSK